MDTNLTFVYKESDKVVKSTDRSQKGKSETEMISQIAPNEFAKIRAKTYNLDMKYRDSYR